MKKTLAALLALISSVAFATTTVPVQLLNPTGSSSGQSIVSTGASSAPAWGGVGLNGIAAIAANTVLANATGSSAAPTALAIPSCSTSSSALNYTTSGGATALTCNTAINAATLVNATWASPPATGYGSTTPEPVAATTISATGLISPTSTIGIKGTVTNDSPSAGSVGEYTPNNTSGTSMASGTPVNCSSQSVAAGDWEIEGTIQFTPATSTNVSGIAAGINTTSATFGAVGTFNSLNATMAAGPATEVMSTPRNRIKLASTTTVYLVGQSTFGTSTMTCNGFIRVTRPR